MILMYSSYLKRLLVRWPLLVLLLACQVVFGYVGSYALSRRPLALRLAVCSEDGGETAWRFVETLKSMPELEVIETVSSDEAVSLALAHETLGAVIIDDGFDRRIAPGGSGSRAVRFVPAPGGNSGLVVQEHVLAALVRIRSEERYKAGMLEVGAPSQDLNAKLQSVLSVQYRGSPFLSENFSVTPGYGVPALFILLIVLLCALAFPGPDDKQIRLRGRGALLWSYVAAAAAASSVCGLLLTVYFLFSGLLYGYLPQPSVMLSFAALGAYCVAAGGILAALGARNLCVWAFLPWLFVNMTLGGGLWGTPIAWPFIKPLLPVVCLLEGCAGDPLAVIKLFAAAVFMTAVAAVTLYFRGRSTEPDVH